MRIVRRLCLPAVVASLVGCTALSDVFTAHSEVAARVGGHELSVATLADVFAVGEALPLTHDAVDRLARHWVDMMMMARRAAVGDSLLDSAVVVEAMWPAVRESLIAVLHERIFAERAQLSAASVDSAYNVGEMRILAHVFRQVTPETTPEEKERQRVVAEQIRAQLERGGSWEAANEQNQDSAAQRANGSLGLVRRGETVPRFENAAFALTPGELSGVTETRFGFHILYRPRLEEVREEFTEALQSVVTATFDSVYGEQLLEAKRVEVRSGTPVKIRQLMTNPERVLGSSRTLATFSNGRFTTGQFARWLQYLPAEVQRQIVRAPDDQINRFTRRLVLQELLWQQVDSAGLQLSDTVFDFVKGQHKQSLAGIWNAAGIAPDLLVSAAATVPERERIAASRVDQYLKAFAAEERNLSPVQPFLAALLSDDTDWEIVPAGIERVVERAGRMRAARRADTTTNIAPELNIR